MAPLYQITRGDQYFALMNQIEPHQITQDTLRDRFSRVNLLLPVETFLGLWRCVTANIYSDTAC